MYLDFFVILNDTDRAREREIERAIKYGEIKYGEREQSNIEIKYGERERERSRRERHLWPFYAWPVNYNKTVLEPIKLLDLNAVECRSKRTFVQ